MQFIQSCTLCTKSNAPRKEKKTFKPYLKRAIKHFLIKTCNFNQIKKKCLSFEKTLPFFTLLQVVVFAYLRAQQTCENKKTKEKTNLFVVEGDDEIVPQPSPAITLTPYQRLTNALQTDPRCAQEVGFKKKQNHLHVNKFQKIYQSLIALHVIMYAVVNVTLFAYFAFGLYRN